ncbi:MAG: phosphatidate cytidylyltransferase [Oscillospiraceae bacterium]|nr:phosphatidate cytidylyltransferase [Oscillospiraceae bacterium]
MLVRILTAVVALPLFFAVVFFLPPFCLVLAVSALCAVAAYELLWRTHAVTDRKAVFLACLLAAYIPLWISYLKEIWMLFLGVFAVFVCLAAMWLKNEKQGSFSKLALTMFGGMIFPLLYATLLLLRESEQGLLVFLLPFIAAWTTDTGAYFVGRFLGKHKLAPVISPKKTVEGAVGGVLICILCMVGYGVIVNRYFDGDFSLVFLAVAGLVLSVLSQMGDLSLSIIKREYNIKDYGGVFPGHGGILDRFDSVLFTAPATYFVLRIFALFV